MAVKIEMEMPKSCQICPLTFNFVSDAFCCKCDDCGYETPVYLHKRAAIDAWNKRS